MLSNQFKKFTPKKKAEVFYSNVSWTKIPDSQDSHDSQEYAITICRKIYWDYSKKECNTR